MDTLQSRLRHKRRAMDMTQAELAELAGVSRATVAMLETVPDREVRSDTLRNLAKVLNVSTDYLISGEVVEHAH